MGLDEACESKGSLVDWIQYNGWYFWNSIMNSIMYIFEKWYMNNIPNWLILSIMCWSISFTHSFFSADIYCHPTPNFNHLLLTPLVKEGFSHYSLEDGQIYNTWQWTDTINSNLSITRSHSPEKEVTACQPGTWGNRVNNQSTFRRLG